MKTSIIGEKSKAFALRIIRLYTYLNKEKHEHVLSKQLLRSGTSIGANVKEALRGQSRPDFVSKMNISLKEASESEYWIELLIESGLLEGDAANSLLDDCRELIKILTAIIKTIKDSQHSYISEDVEFCLPTMNYEL